jgi:hypothetical protein
MKRALAEGATLQRSRAHGRTLREGSTRHYEGPEQNLWAASLALRHGYGPVLDDQTATDERHQTVADILGPR